VRRQRNVRIMSLKNALKRPQFLTHTESAAALYKDLTDAKTLLSRRVSGAFITDLRLAHKPFDHQILLEQ
jgi:hypothetical protein